MTISESHHGNRITDSRRSVYKHDGLSTISKAVFNWREFDETVKRRDSSEREQVTRQSPTSSWSPPLNGVIRINTDAAINVRKGRCGYGIVARDGHGKILASWAISANGVCAAKVAEAVAIRWALQKAKSEGWTEVEVQAD